MTLQNDDFGLLINSLLLADHFSVFRGPFSQNSPHGIKLGENVFINYNGTMLGGGLITIGRNTQVGPNCQFLTPNHPTDYIERRKPIKDIPADSIAVGNPCRVVKKVSPSQSPR